MSVTARPALLIGIMSGTSADGIDIAIVRCHNKPDTHIELIHFSEFPMPAALRRAILHLASPVDKNNRFEGEATDDFDCIDNLDRMGELNRMLGQTYAEGSLTAIRQAGLHPADIAAIGCHGQTIRHRPNQKHAFSLQIGCAAILAEQTGITVISDFRSRDIAAAGEGAPLVPFAHQQLFASSQQHTAVLNIGGIANVSWLGSDGSITGFDIGAGNMLMDALMLRISDGQQAYDHNGQLAASGTVSPTLLQQLMQHPFLQRQAPKSTGREEFGAAIVRSIMHWPNISHADRMASACQFTAASIKQSIALMPATPAKWLCCGGGVRNQHLMQLLKQQLAPASVDSTAAAGLPPQAVEAVCFALLAKQTLLGKPNTLSAVTGASHDVCGGHITPGNNWSTLLQTIPTWIR